MFLASNVLDASFLNGMVLGLLVTIHKSVVVQIELLFSCIVEANIICHVPFAKGESLERNGMFSYLQRSRGSTSIFTRL